MARIVRILRSLDIIFLKCFWFPSAGVTQANRFYYYTRGGKKPTNGYIQVNGTRPMQWLRHWETHDLEPITELALQKSKTITSDSNNYTRWTFCYFQRVVIFCLASLEEKEEKIGSIFPLMIVWGWQIHKKEHNNRKLGKACTFDSYRYLYLEMMDWNSWKRLRISIISSWKRKPQNMQRFGTWYRKLERGQWHRVKVISVCMGKFTCRAMYIVDWMGCPVLSLWSLKFADLHFCKFSSTLNQNSFENGSRLLHFPLGD